jgi:ABC-type Fe3+ transport system permease subunit/DNA-binding beta-propeller fold protein YncE
VNWLLLKNSLLVAGAATLLALLFGLAAALWLAGRESVWRHRFLGAAIIALALPPFLVSDGWLFLLGQTGVLRGWLPLSIYSLGGAAWILSLLLWPITLLLTLGAWQKLESGQFECDPLLHGTRLVRWLLLPSARTALIHAGVLTFVLALNQFAVPAILQVKVYPAEVYVRFSTNFDAAGALASTWPLILAPLLMLVWLSRREVAWPRLEAGVAAALFRRRLGTAWSWSCGAITAVVALLAVVLPLAQPVASLTAWQGLQGVFAAGSSAFAMSFLSAAATATVALALGLVSWRLPVGTLVWFPFLVPGVVLGIGLILLLNRPGLSVVYQSSAVVVLALTLRYLAAGWHGASRARQSVDRDLTDAAVLEGASRWQLLRHVLWPQMAPQLAAAWYVTYLLCLWDVETLVLIIPPGGETLALRIFNLLHYGHNTQVNALCLLLLALALLPLALWRLGRWLRPALARWSGVACSALALAALLNAGCARAPESSRLAQSRFFERVEIIGARGTGPGQFNKPRSVAVDAADNLYVVDMTGRVQKFGRDGAFVLAWQMPQTDLGKPKGMCRDHTGRVIVLEPHYARVNHFSAEGKLLWQWGRHGTNTGELGLPRSVAVNSRGEVLVSEYGVTERVQRFSADGATWLASLGRFGDGPGEFNRAEGLGLDAADRLYVADSCNHRVQVFSAAGQWLRAYGRAGGGPGQLSYPYDVRVDAAGYQFVCEFGNSRIQVFDSEDRPVETLGGPGPAPGQLSNPWSIALDSAGNLYVADAGNHRVQKFVRKPA